MKKKMGVACPSLLLKKVPKSAPPIVTALPSRDVYLDLK